MAYPFRAKADGVFCEIGVPDDTRRVRDAVIYCPGLPSGPTYPRLLRRLQAEGYVGVALRYRGTWESDGRFLERCPVADVRAVRTLLKRGVFTDLSSGTRIALRIRKVFLIGSSFGGYVALQALKETPIERAVLLAPVISMAELGDEPDWTEEENEPFARMLRDAWPQVYRYTTAGYRRLITDGLCGSGHERLAKLRQKRLLIFHSRDDDVVNVNRSRRFVRAARAAGVDATLRELRQGHGIRLRAPQVRDVLAFFRHGRQTLQGLRP